MFYNVYHVMLYNMCHITYITYVMLCNITCFVMLYNMCHVMLCYITLSCYVI